MRRELRGSAYFQRNGRSRCPHSRPTWTELGFQTVDTSKLTSTRDEEDMKTKMPINTFRLTMTLLAAALCTIATTGCNTMHGLGRDVERTGEKIEQASKK